MRVLFTTFSMPSHLQNLVPLAWAMRAAGHEVRVASHPDLVPVIQGAGLTSVAVGAELNFAARHAEVPFGETIYGAGVAIGEERPDVLTADYARRVFDVYIHAPLALDFLMGEGFLDDLVAFARRWQPDLIVWDSLTYAGPVAAKAVGAAHVRVLSGIDNWARMWALARSDSHPDRDPVAAWLGERLRKFGCDFDEDVVFGQATVDPLPSWMRPPGEGSYVSMRPVPYCGPCSVPSWVDDKPRAERVCLSLGMTGRVPVRDGFSVADMVENGTLIGEIVAAAGELEIELIATLSREEIASVAEVPDNVRVVDFVPLNELLPSCSGIVHHGGTGTTNLALLHGVPQLIVPSAFWDEAQKAAAVARRGVGLAFSDQSTGLRDQLRRLVADRSLADQARAARDELSQTATPHDLVPQLEKLACAPVERIS